eukprot:CAMPEP_0185592806 /NCGR_PEP_ID=MMETSP0434-20130131/69262_1 /TAXON_ID=626734 ORGANISM="Favella taraikaensis, Strain Fe Narragansett Bay" /NCGR_SAMPLE_ID=MMETSP0434 /ASSEMBLY_ACC=CAM_ASM_000379 /LENGTH=85 /DNA_ID=CAMNT_0028218911 /DNA_START=270 /DNA_END=524 /DNA_ORIENTATION=+
MRGMNIDGGYDKEHKDRHFSRQVIGRMKNWQKGAPPVRHDASLRASVMAKKQEEDGEKEILLEQKPHQIQPSLKRKMRFPAHKIA